MKPSPLTYWGLILVGGMLCAASCSIPRPDERVTPTDTAPQARGGQPGTNGSGGSAPSVGSGGSGGSAGSPAVPGPDTPFSKQALLEAAGQCALARYREVEQKTAELSQRAGAWASDPSDATRGQLQQAWLEAMQAWQVAEVFRFGPAAVSSDPGGQDLRDQIYAFPFQSRCKIDEALVDQSYASDFAALTFNRKGFGALEYLIFYGGSDNGCTAFSPINGDGTWAALSAEELLARKSGYAAAAAADLKQQSSKLVAAWSPDGGNFAATLLAAGSSQSPYTSEQHALNAVSDALFYIEKEVKDFKLGKPLGLYECVSDTCPSALESLYAARSQSFISQNLRGFRLLFQGCGPDYSGLGFDDWLTAVGAGDLSARMLQALTAAERAVAALDPTLDQALTSNPTPAREVHAVLKVLTDLLKADFVTALNLELPKAAEGDND